MQFKFSLQNKIYELEYFDLNPQCPRVLLCVHGLSRNSSDFTFLADDLKDQFRVIALDLPGHGASQWLEQGSFYSYYNYCKIITDFIQHLGLENINYLGTSLGGIIGMYLASSRIKFNSLILNDIGPFIAEKALRKLAEYLQPQPSFSTQPKAMEYIKFLYSPMNLGSEERYWQHIFTHTFYHLNDRYTFRYDPRITDYFYADVKKITNFDLWHVWDKLDLPILAIRGKESKILSEETLDKMQRSDRVSQLEYQCGHNPPLFTSTQINDIRLWLIR